MKVFLCSLSLLVLTLISCENENQQLEAQKVAQKNEAVFKNISKMWQFNFPTPRPEVAATLGRWNEWRQFEIEMRQKPQSTLSAFQMKTKNLSKKADTLVLTVPFEYNKPQILSRITTLNTKLKSLETNMEQLHIVLKDKEKIISLYEFMLNNSGNNRSSTIADVG